MPIPGVPNFQSEYPIGSYIDQFPIYDFVGKPDPVRQQQALAEMLRRQQVSGDALQSASRQGHSLDNMAAISHMANNPDAAEAAGAAAKFTQQRYAPVQLGNTGFAIPGTGQFAENPMYAADRQATREQTLELQRGRQIMQQSIAAMNNAQRTRGQDVGGAVRIIVGEGHDAVGHERNANTAARAGQGQRLPSQAVSKLTGVQNSALDFDNVAGSFQEKFAGPAALTGVQNYLGKSNLPGGIGNGYRDQANWWQMYNDWVNVKRHDLFGSALTAQEANKFDRANITEGMKPEEIRTRLAQQQAAVHRAYNVLLQNYGKAGYNTDNFDPFDAGEIGFGPKPGNVTGQGGSDAASQIPGGGAGGAPNPADIDDILRKYGGKK